MHAKEDLNQYRGAYEPKFQFYDENLWYLEHYARRMCHVIRERGVHSMLSLGIGHQVVSELVLEEMNHTLRSYTVLEGSEQIIRDFSSAHILPSGVKLVHTYFEDYDGSGRFDAVELGFVLEHVDDPVHLVEKYKEFLNPDGILFVAVPNARSLHRMIGHEAGLLDDIYQLSECDHELGHKRYFDLNSICALVEDAGLTVTRRQGLMLKPVTGDQIKQLGWGKNIIEALFKIGDDYPEMANCILIEATV